MDSRAKKLRDVLANNALTEEEQIRYVQQSLNESFEDGKNAGFNRYELVMARVKSEVAKTARKNREKNIKSFMTSIHALIELNRENKKLNSSK